MVLINGEAVGIKFRTGNMAIKKAEMENISKGVFRNFHVAKINSRKKI